MAKIFNVLNLEEPSMIEVPSSESQPVKPKKKGPQKQIKTPTGMTLAEVESSSDDIQFGAMLFIEEFNNVPEVGDTPATGDRVDLTEHGTFDAFFAILTQGFDHGIG